MLFASKHWQSKVLIEQYFYTDWTLSIQICSSFSNSRTLTASISFALKLIYHYSDDVWMQSRITGMQVQQWIHRFLPNASKRIKWMWKHQRKCWHTGFCQNAFEKPCVSQITWNFVLFLCTLSVSYFFQRNMSTYRIRVVSLAGFQA